MNHAFARITVTFCLIVATTIQPMLVYALGNRCGDPSCDVQAMCDGCGRCEVDKHGDKCCCCSHANVSSPSSDAKTTSSGCGEPAELTPVYSEPAVVSHCTCGVSVPPMDRSNPREQLAREVTVRIASLDFVLLPVVVEPRRRACPVDGSAGHRDDFSQRFLCVWRI